MHNAPPGLHHFRNPADFQKTDINRVKQTPLTQKRPQNQFSLGKLSKLTHLSQTCCRYNWCSMSAGGYMWTPGFKQMKCDPFWCYLCNAVPR